MLQNEPKPRPTTPLIKPGGLEPQVYVAKENISQATPHPSPTCVWAVREAPFPVLAAADSRHGPIVRKNSDSGRASSLETEETCLRRYLPGHLYPGPRFPNFLVTANMDRTLTTFQARFRALHLHDVTL